MWCANHTIVHDLKMKSTSFFPFCLLLTIVGRRHHSVEAFSPREQIWRCASAQQQICEHQHAHHLMGLRRSSSSSSSSGSTRLSSQGPISDRGTPPEADDQTSTSAVALPPSDASLLSSSPAAPLDDDLGAIAAATASTATMITANQKRILIEELGYSRSEVEQLRVELAAPIIDKRMRRPASYVDDGLPEEWQKSQQEMMLDKLESESKYPLKFPLLGVSTILFGKGFSDALITVIKVNMDFPGVSMGEEFFGVPVLFIDALCVALGAALGTWTWKTMRD